MYENPGRSKERANGKYTHRVSILLGGPQRNALVFEDMEEAKQVSIIRRDGREGESVGSGDDKVIKWREWRNGRRYLCKVVLGSPHCTVE